MKYILTFLLFFTLFYQFSDAQDTNYVAPEYQIKLIAKVEKDEIILRFAPNKALTWHYGNQYGYKIERYTIARDSQLLNTAEYKLLTPIPQKPAPEEDWKNVATNNFIIAAYQAIYGEDFEINKNESMYMQIKDHSSEIENRFSFSLFACDNSIDAAILSGLVFYDKNIKSNEKYVYKVSVDCPPNILDIKPGTYFVDAGKITTYPKPINLQAKIDNNSVILFWNQLYYSGIYSSWIIERSDDDGKTYSAVNENPYVQINTSKTPEDIIKFVDTVPEYNKNYYYRIRGNSPFGEYGPASDSVSVKIEEKLSAYPEIEKVVSDNNGNVFISWNYPEINNSKIIGFKIISSLKDYGIADTLNDILIPSDQRVFIDKKPQSVNYYKIIAIDKNLKEYYSPPFLFQIADSIPPSIPTELSGNIDSSGIVLLKWAKNPEPDISGYRIYISNSRNEEFSQLTKKSISDTFFIYKTTLNTLTEDIFVKIMAEDNHFNPSDFSEIVKISRPDTIKPSAPVFKSFKINDNSISLKWANSSSKDVVNHILFRSIANKNEWIAIAIFDNEHNYNSFEDSTATPGQSYDYAIVAIDDANNKSEIDNTIQLQMPKKLFVGNSVKIKAKTNYEETNIKISWTLPTEEIKKIILYKGIDNNSILKYKEFLNPISFFIDKNVQINSQYTYQIRIIYNSGKSSPYSQKAYVKY